ncbi:MAG: hypothetical protein FGM47_00010 [Candidatus Nanopelagicaceae bacterium]|nr:hypothetical protein [Candidatus Nanopelagicaceae bacterium]
MENRERKSFGSRSSGKKFDRKPSDQRPSDRKPSDRKPSDRKPSDRKPSDRRVSDGEHNKPRTSGARPARGGADRRPARNLKDETRRVRKFAEPAIPEEITGKELEKREAFSLQSLAIENAEMVAKHLVALNMFLESDPERAYWHGQSAVFRAGRVAIVREKAGIAALHFKKFDVAIRELRAAQRISGSPSVIPYLAQCELALGDPRKTLEIAGSVDPKLLTVEQKVELRIAAAGARSALKQFDAAVVTLTCPELTLGDANWSTRLRTAYRDALLQAGRNSEADSFMAKYPQSFSAQQI